MFLMETQSSVSDVSAHPQKDIFTPGASVLLDVAVNVDQYTFTYKLDWLSKCW